MELTEVEMEEMAKEMQMDPKPDFKIIEEEMAKFSGAHS